MKILAFAASNSKNSINKQLVNYATSLLNGHNIEIIDLNDYELPLFSEDKEAELNQPQLARDFYQKIGKSDAIVIAFAEHNGSYTAAYKNIFDWASRINQKVFQSKPMVMLATSPGPGGAASVLATATNSAPYFDGNVVESLSVPAFYDNYDANSRRITNNDINEKLRLSMERLVTEALDIKQAS